MTEGKRNIICQLIKEYNIETATDIQYALKYLFDGTIEMMEAAMDNHLGYEKPDDQGVTTIEIETNKVCQQLLWQYGHSGPIR